MLFIHLPDNIDSSEVVSHFILTKSEYSSEKNQVKARALEPSKIDNSISVFRINELNDDEVLELGKQYMELPVDKNIRARADINVSNILSLNLSIESVQPPPRHANVFKWPEAKSAMMAIAQELAARSALKIYGE